MSSNVSEILVLLSQIRDGADREVQRLRDLAGESEKEARGLRRQVRERAVYTKVSARCCCHRLRMCCAAWLQVTDAGNPLYVAGGCGGHYKPASPAGRPGKRRARHGAVRRGPDELLTSAARDVKRRAAKQTCRHIRVALIAIGGRQGGPGIRRPSDEQQSGQPPSPFPHRCDTRCGRRGWRLRAWERFCGHPVRGRFPRRHGGNPQRPWSGRSRLIGCPVRWPTRRDACAHDGRGRPP